MNGKAVPVGFARSNQINLYLPTSVKLGTNHLTVTVQGVTGSGHALSVYLTGVGKVDSTALRNATYPWSATIGGVPADKLFLGSAPSLPGVYQADILVPETLGPGSYALAFKVNGVTSEEVVIEVAAK